MSHDVVFASPTLSHHVCVEFFTSAIETDRHCAANGIKAAWMQIGGDPYLSKVRCKLMSKFLTDFPDCQNFFFLDDDIGWPAHKAIEFIQNPNPVLAGIYPKKSEKTDFPMTLAGDPETGQLIRHGSFVLAREVPTGFLRLKREVLVKLAETSGKFVELIGGKQVSFTEFCSMGTGSPDANGDWVGEDYDLSRRIMAAGFNIWVDPNIPFSHRGAKAWRDCLADHLDKVGLPKSEKEITH